MTRWMGWVLALTLLGAQGGCDTNRTDSDGDGIHDGADCDPHSRSNWKNVPAYDDPDGDGYGSGEVHLLCVGKELPTGLSLQTGDCAPEDPKRWLELTGKGYYTDADRDGRNSIAPATGCVGADVSAYRKVPGTDCDDTNGQIWQMIRLYPDTDGDGRGAGELAASCVGDPAALPKGLSLDGTDCEPEDATRFYLWSYQGRDADGDGYFVSAPGHLCIGATVPRGYTNSSSPGPDCDDTRADVWSVFAQYADPDGDGVGSGPPLDLCSAGAPLPGHSRSTGDCAPEDATRWMNQSYYYRDADGDGASVFSSGTVCAGYALPAGYATASSATLDCDDTRAEVSRGVRAFVDSDGDGVGAGDGEVLCTGPALPTGYAGTGTDCAPEDASRWRANTLPFRDVDGDGYTVSAAPSVCLGTSSESHTNTTRGSDCDDTRADVFWSLQVYVDTDADGVGAGSVLTACTNGTPPSGHSLQGSDCAPEDAARWKVHTVRFLDADGDGYTQPNTGPGQVCAADALPPPYTAAASGNDCDDADPARFLWRVLYPDRDGDGVGAPPREVWCLGASGLPPGYSIYGYDPDDTNPARAEPPEDPELDEAVLSR